MFQRICFLVACTSALCVFDGGQEAEAQGRNITIILGQPAFPGGSRPVIVVGADRYVGATGFLPVYSNQLPRNNTKPPPYQGTRGLNNAYYGFFDRDYRSTVGQATTRSRFSRGRSRR